MLLYIVYYTKSFAILSSYVVHDSVQSTSIYIATGASAIHRLQVLDSWEKSYFLNFIRRCRTPKVSQLCMDCKCTQFLVDECHLIFIKIPPMTKPTPNVKMDVTGFKDTSATCTEPHPYRTWTKKWGRTWKWWCNNYCCLQWQNIYLQPKF